MSKLTALNDLKKMNIANSGACELAVMVDIDKIKLDDEFKNLFPVNKIMIEKIEKSILENGYDKSQPIHVWKEEMILVDGHHRRLAAINAGLKEVPVFYHHFENLNDALEYTILLQTNRRNLSDAEILKAIQTLDSLKSKGTKSSNSTEEKGKSAEITAKKIGVSRSKIEKARTIEKRASAEIKEAVADGKISINAAYNETVGKTKNKKTTKKLDWISLETELPEEDIEILVVDSFRKISIIDSNLLDGEKYSYWMILPELPKEI